MLLNVTAPGLRQQQASLGDALRAIRSQFDPRDTTVVTVTGQDPYRFMMYYLPEYQVLRLDPQTQSVLAAQGRHQGTWTARDPSACLFGEAGVHHAVWVLSIVSESGLVPSDALPITSADEGPFQVWAVAPGPETPDYLGFKLGGDCVRL